MAIDYLSELTAELKNRAKNYRATGRVVMGTSLREGQVLPALQQLQSEAGTGGAPTRVRYVTYDPATGQGLNFDAAKYQEDMFAWMRGQDQYQDWTDQDLRTFLGNTTGKSSQAAAAESWWQGQNIAWRKASEDAAKDRAGMLAELQAFKAGIGEQYVTQALTREKGYWEAKIGQTLLQVQQQYAAMGRTASPYLLGELRRRMVGQAADSLQTRRLELETEVQNQKAKYLTMLGDVLGNTQRTMIDPTQAAQILQSLGAGASTVKAGA